MTYRRDVALIVSISTEHEYDGHEILINGQAVAFRKYSGADTDDVTEEIAKALGSVLLGKLQEGEAAYQEQHRRWQSERPDDDDY
jgi:hypothetical protein